MASYQQIPIGIPIYSQNAYPTHPYSSNFPDESETEPFQVQAPSLENNQQINPQYYSHGQQSVQVTYPSQFYPPGQAYNQPQYFMIANSIPADPERRKLEKSIREFNERLDSGWYLAYKVYLYINIGFCWFMSIMCGLGLIIGLIIHIIDSEDESNFLADLLFPLLLFTWSIWLLQQCLVVKNAMNNRSLEGAKRGLRSMLWYSIYYLVTLLAPVLYGSSGMRLDGYLWIFGIFVIVYAIPTFLKIFGAEKVIELLKKREPLLLELNAKYKASFV